MKSLLVSIAMLAFTASCAPQGSHATTSSVVENDTVALEELSGVKVVAIRETSPLQLVVASGMTQTTIFLRPDTKVQLAGQPSHANKIPLNASMNVKGKKRGGFFAEEVIVKAEPELFEGSLEGIGETSPPRITVIPTDTTLNKTTFIFAEESVLLNADNELIDIDETTDQDFGDANLCVYSSGSQMGPFIIADIIRLLPQGNRCDPMSGN